jgi:hypothetical protein
MPRPTPANRKRRTREHVIADLGVNHVERQALLSNFSIERIVHDYGVDALLFTYDRRGETQPVWVPIQIKATDHPRFVGQNRFISVRVERTDLRSWLANILPVILVVYDAQNEVAYWIYVQAYFGRQRFGVGRGPGRVTIRIPTSQVFNPPAIRQIVGYRDRMLARLEGSVEHHD